MLRYQTLWFQLLFLFIYENKMNIYHFNQLKWGIWTRHLWLFLSRTVSGLSNGAFLFFRNKWGLDLVLIWGRICWFVETAQSIRMTYFKYLSWLTTSLLSFSKRTTVANENGRFEDSHSLRVAIRNLILVLLCSDYQITCCRDSLSTDL